MGKTSAWGPILARLQRAAGYLGERYYTRGGALTLRFKRYTESQIKRYRHHSTRFGQLHWINATPHTTYEDVIRALRAQNLRVGALDTEYSKRPTGETLLHEVGLASLVEGAVRTKHLIVDARPPRSRKTRRFKHGASRQVDHDTAAEVVQEWLDSHDVVLLWHADEDLKVLRRALDVRVPARHVLDLCFWTSWTSEYNGCLQTQRLSQFCNDNRVHINGIHNAGNDADALLRAALRAFEKVEHEGS